MAFSDVEDTFCHCSTKLFCLIYPRGPFFSSCWAPNPLVSDCRQAAQDLGKPSLLISPGGDDWATLQRDRPNTEALEIWRRVCLCSYQEENWEVSLGSGEVAML